MDWALSSGGDLDDLNLGGPVLGGALAATLFAPLAAAERNVGGDALGGTARGAVIGGIAGDAGKGAAAGAAGSLLFGEMRRNW